jgi:hypothetical protein
MNMNFEYPNPDIDNHRPQAEFNRRGDKAMDAPRKQKSKHPPLEPRPTGEKLDAKQVVERVMKRYPKTMARLAE